ncbi:signal recognition particle-docking protein FtsY [Halomonas sp. TRM85114]|uniref:signal recognition particle-docking protein FtsY n=1 Tax=Halomonas jincaotanensis TaxID=2810616 RepID=UPI001BD642F0|nr:signal recognition particle-docking protein FtsY [Halomonas jincaotanensis]MBS9403058.1 signal recognition particle-docking protein FtsY [Halomonas jincaotanensis]
MLGFFKRKKPKDSSQTPDSAESEALTDDTSDVVDDTTAEAAELRQPEAVDDVAAPTAEPPVEAPDEPPVETPDPPVEKPVRAALQEKPGSSGTAGKDMVGKDTAGKEKAGWFSRMRAGLGKTRASFTEGVAGLFLGSKQIDDDLMEELETQLLMADVGIEATTEIIDRLTDRVSRKELKEPQALYRALQEELSGMLEPVTRPLVLPPKGSGPFVILVVGVNGVGKTTTIGKLTQRFQREGRSVMLAAGDTFRAAAVEQLQVWGERNSVPVIAQHSGADSASVVFDAVAAAKARKIDVLIADTAGRLHNKAHLMEELKKVHRVMGKLDDTAPHEVMLVLDAGTGQNAISQASTFNEAVPITGITLTKLDGTAKGGIIFALAKQLGTPIRFIGVGESLDDLRPFVATEFVDALFDRERADAEG